MIFIAASQNDSFHLSTQLIVSPLAYLSKVVVAAPRE